MSVNPKVKKKNKAKIICVANQKGGVGKTTTTHNLSVILANEGYDVCGIDMDAQASLTFSVGIDPMSADGKNIVTLLTKDSGIEVHECIYNIKESLDIIPSIIDLASIEIEMFTRPSRETILSRAIEPIMYEYDYIIIDCPPQLSILSLNALSATDTVIIPVKTDILAYRGLGQLKDTIAEVKELINFDIKIEGVIATIYESISNDDNEILELLKEDNDVLGVIHKTTKAKKGLKDSIPLIEFDKNHKSSKTYLEIADIIK